MDTGTKTGTCCPWFMLCAAIAAHGLVYSGSARAQEPADRELIPEARRILDYLRQVQGKGIPTGISDVGGGGGGPHNALHRTGREPAIL